MRPKWMIGDLHAHIGLVAEPAQYRRQHLQESNSNDCSKQFKAMSNEQRWTATMNKR